MYAEMLDVTLTAPARSSLSNSTASSLSDLFKMAAGSPTLGEPVLAQGNYMRQDQSQIISQCHMLGSVRLLARESLQKGN